MSRVRDNLEEVVGVTLHEMPPGGEIENVWHTGVTALDVEDFPLLYILCSL